MKEYVKYRTSTSTRKKYTDILRADGSPGTHFMHMRVNFFLFFSSLFTEQCALMAIDCTGGEKKEQILGLPLLMDAYTTHRDNADVVEAIASVIGELVTYGKMIILLIFCTGFTPSTIIETMSRQGIFR